MGNIRVGRFQQINKTSFCSPACVLKQGDLVWYCNKANVSELLARLCILLCKGTSVIIVRPLLAVVAHLIQNCGRCHDLGIM